MLCCLCTAGCVEGQACLSGAGVLVSDLLKERVQCGSAAYWAVVCSVVPLVLLVTVLVRVQKRSLSTAQGHCIAEACGLSVDVLDRQ